MRKKSDQLASSPDLILPVDKIGGGVQFTDRLEKPSHRRKRLNQYLRGDRIGKGRHGEVYLCYDTLHDNGEVVCLCTFPYLLVHGTEDAAFWQAIKLVKRNSPKDKIKLLRKTYQQASGSARYAITSTENSVRREIAVMKECRHPNLAALLEVIDDQREDKIYLGEQYTSGPYVLSYSRAVCSDGVPWGWLGGMGNRGPSAPVDPDPDATDNAGRHTWVGIL